MTLLNELFSRCTNEISDFAEQESYLIKEPVAYLVGDRTFDPEAWQRRTVADADIAKLPVFQQMNDDEFIILERPDVCDGEHIEAVIFDNNGIGWIYSIDTSLPEEGFMCAAYALPTTDGLAGFRPDEAFSSLFAARDLISASTKFAIEEQQALLEELTAFLDGVWVFIKRILLIDVADDILQDEMLLVTAELERLHPKMWSSLTAHKTCDFDLSKLNG